MGYVFVISLPLLIGIIALIVYLVRARALRQRAQMNHGLPVQQPPIPTPYQGYSPGGAVHYATSAPPPPPYQAQFQGGPVFQGTPVQAPPFQAHFQHGQAYPPQPPPYQGQTPKYAQM